MSAAPQNPGRPGPGALVVTATDGDVITIGDDTVIHIRVIGRNKARVRIVSSGRVLRHKLHGEETP